MEKNSGTLVIIPALREFANLVNLIPQIKEADVLIADDHSQDGTETLAGGNVFVLDRINDHGYGRAVLDGFHWALARSYDRIVTMDADFSHDPAIIEKLKNNISIGSRYVPGGKIANWSFYRKLLSRFSNIYVRVILNLPINDCTTGFVGYSREAVEYLVKNSPKSDGYAFLVECKYLLAKAGFTFLEIPITYTERREGQSKMSWRVIWESIWLPWRLKFRRN